MALIFEKDVISIDQFTVFCNSKIESIIIENEKCKIHSLAFSKLKNLKSIRIGNRLYGVISSENGVVYLKTSKKIQGRFTIQRVMSLDRHHCFMISDKSGTIIVKHLHDIKKGQVKVA